MPGSYLIDVPRRIVFSQAWGVLTDDEVISHARTLRDDPRFEPTFRQVIDFRGLLEMKITTAGVRGVAERNPFRTDSRRALVVASDEAFGMARMDGSYSDSAPDQFQVFRELGPAMAWVGLDPATEWPRERPHAMFS